MWNRHVQSQGIVSTKFKVVVGGMGMTQDDVVGEHAGLSLVPVMSSFSQVGVSLHYLYFCFFSQRKYFKKKSGALPKVTQLVKDEAGQEYMPPDS